MQFALWNLQLTVLINKQYLCSFSSCPALLTSSMSLLKMAVVFIFRLLITPSFTYNLPISHYNDCASPAAWLASFITPIIFYPVRCPQYNSLTGFRCCVVHLNSLITSGWLYLFVRPLFNATLGSSLSSVIMSSVCFFFVNLRLLITTDLQLTWQ